MGYQLPVSIEINGTPFQIRDNGDFRMVFSCFRELNDISLTQYERLATCLILFYEDLNDLDDLQGWDDMQEATEKMFDFFNCGDKVKSNTSNLRLIDWDEDATLVCSAINNVANREIRSAEYLHWWTFIGYYMSIGECPLSTIVSIRYKKAKGKKLEKHERQFVMDNPQYFQIDTRTAEQKEMDEYIKGLWDT